MFVICCQIQKPGRILLINYRKAVPTALIYGEAQAAESRADFIHKMKMVLKEVRESRVNLKIIKKKPLLVNEKVDLAFNEASQLMAIFLKSIETARGNDERLKK